jgi:glycosyltransferase 2 family protein
MRYKSLIRLLGPVIFVAILLFFIDPIQIIQAWRSLQYDYLGLSLLTVPFIVAVRSIRWQRVLATYDMSYPVWTCFKYNFVEMIAVAIVSSAGSLIKTFYLRRDGYSFSTAILSIFSDKAFDFLLPLLFGIFSAVSFYFNLDPDNALLGFLVMIAVLFKPIQMAGISIFPKTIPKRLKEKITDKKWRFEHHFQQILMALDYRSYLLSTVGFLLYFLSIYFLNIGLGLNFSFSQIVCIMALTSLITAIPISFMGIGTRDAALIAVFTWYGRSAEEAVSLSLGLLLLRLSIMFMGSLFWYLDPPPLSELKKRGNE